MPLRAPIPARQINTGWVGVQSNGQVISGASRSFGYQANSHSPIIIIYSFKFLSNVPNGPFFRHLPRNPLCRGRADTHRPQGDAAPVTWAQKPRASRLLVDCWAGGLHWRQKWG